MEKDLLKFLEYIDPGSCSYQEWIDVGMALKHEGYNCSVWDEWSEKDFTRYHRGECRKKWRGFNGAASPVTGGTLFHMAMERGYQPAAEGHELDWDSPIDSDGIINMNWVEDRDIQAPEAKNWHPGRQLIEYLEALFEPGETVGFVTESWKNDKGKYIPKNKGVYTKTAGQLIEELTAAGDDIGSVVGDYDKNGGAWIRFNPLDGQGVKNDNVSDYRYALVESDDMELERQNGLIHELELPVAVLVHSGGKSLHAIVRIDAVNYPEYRKRVDYLYEICEKNGMRIDKQNRNPSRLSRMPGCIRGENKQFIVEKNIGKASWNEWKEWTEAVNDDLPDIDDLSSVWDNMPQLGDSLIENLLREGHKMLISGPSKAGKSFLLIELTIAIAEGRKWLNWQCSKGKVLYVNLELDKASCFNRFKDVYENMQLRPENLQNIEIWNLRGKSVPMDKLAPKLIRRARKQGYKAIIIDPIYKVITGDENSADQMAQFCNQFDLICTELECAVIYCHHHSKGTQGQKKAVDRASGSGVFARDPDAVIDLIELELTDDIKAQNENKVVCNAITQFLTSRYYVWPKEEEPDPDTRLNSKTYYAAAENALARDREELLNEFRKQIDEARRSARVMTGWEIQGKLREFPDFEPVKVWFKYPAHYIDASDTLKSARPEVEKSLYELRKEANKEQQKKDKENKISSFELAFESLADEDEKVLAEALAEQIGMAPKTVCGWFGNTNRRIPELCKMFKKIQEKGKPVYFERKNKL